MAHILNYDPERKIIFAIHTGKVNKEDLMTGQAEAAKLLEETGCRRILVDQRGIELNTSVSDEFQFSGASYHVIPDDVKVAVVINRDDPWKKDHMFMQSVNLNRGSQVVVFDDQAEAEKWLME